MGKGRPSQFRNAAEKQKAYRERKKQADIEVEALRKSEWENSLEGLADAVDVLAREYDAQQARFPKFGAENVPAWSKELTVIHENWWKAHSRWYAAWKAAGYPVGKKPKTSRW